MSNSVDRQRFREYMKASEKEYAKALGYGDQRLAAIRRHVAYQATEYENIQPFLFVQRMKRIPVTIREFVESEDFIGSRLEVWPKVMEDMEAIYPDVFTGAVPVHEANLGGAAGIGKSTIIQVGSLYTIYLFSCFDEPQRLYGLAPTTWIQIPLMSETTRRANDLLYVPSRQLFEAMPFAKRYLRHNKDKTSALEIEGNLKLYSGPADVSTFIGGATPAMGFD